ncbi:NAD(P)-dependent dehydrogenase (short-subunit alcohol dehydrogenase family) [Streptomyces sp. SAI-135]|jgi:NAD(P)-dependent dehydrogenase (short-subunit alcohol dehydrogenase family)|uniref:SDR family NAD(P)-dependent oxidoreductase n=1 Tax=unclassified Streptomyces TaxID=2593676 RepID=UPI002473D1D5|nr:MULTISPECIES: SDR family oxidoreductase [unclassified Streptomyces]MDH6522899.1 NAD(P)-dependent dehydrogenase (short-subunit alcohol dehydrogenase family) [Streptomyces sp. SAI-090]MDH6554520.1 NAD(P)-dependent dehydrogenase (short-subunit alcohol dehydrogenase family) [Streptomyces sp. SAI-041]MDH6573786.1 NAD(P)-dependent dehydrogenase (short-subunit alcohol dehydrogenase family) [Streptomyces sp. SAI-117]MDH6581483.1 NAD(P)-dependent dehydrogenase (short-subunit alcohol dehydrogenase fam
MPTTIALVTGGNRGIGRSIVEALAADGRDIIFTYNTDEGRAKEVVEAVAAHGRIAVALHLDVTQSAALPGFTDTVRQTLRDRWDRDTFDILVNNAGIALHSPLGSTDEETMDRLFAVHVKGCYLLTQALATAPDGTAPLLTDGGRIVNLSTGLARFVTPPYAVYGAVKGAVEVLTRYWATELGGRGISVNSIAPGPVSTDFDGGHLRDDENLQQILRGLTARGRIAEADDIGPAVAALVSEGTHWITGQRIEASGGFRL